MAASRLQLVITPTIVIVAVVVILAKDVVVLTPQILERGRRLTCCSG